jgi:hypothetical protein
MSSSADHAVSDDRGMDSARPERQQMHFTYTSPGMSEYYRRNKKFAEEGSHCAG